MADRDVQVEYTLKDSASSGMEKLAKSADAVSKSTTESQRKIDSLAASEKKIDDLARKRIANAKEELAVKSRIGQLGGLPGQAAGGGGFQIPGAVKAAFGISAAAQAFQGFGNALEELSQKPTTAGEALEVFTLKTLETIPILGQLSKGVKDIAGALSGETARIAGAQKFAESAARQNEQAGFAAEARFGGSQQIAALRRRQAELRLNAAEASGFAASLTPEALAGFRPRARFGEATEQTGALRMAEARAQFGVNFAGQVTAGREAAAGRTAAEIQRLRGLEQRQRGELATLEQRSQVKGDKATAAEASAQALAKLGQLDNTRAELLRQQSQYQKELLDVEQARGQEAQKQLQLDQARVATAKDQLTIVNQQVDAARGLARVVGGARPGELRSAEIALKKLNERGSGALSQRERGAIAALGQAGQERLNQADEARGREDPRTNRLLQLLGQPSLGALEKEQARLNDLINKATSGADAKLAEGIANAFDGVIDQMIESILAAVETTLDRKAAQLSKKTLDERLAGQPKG